MIGFAAPWFLLVALLAGVVLLLHSHRRQRIEVPSLLLWRDLQIPASTRRSRRRWPPLSLPLVLQLAAVILAALALAQPYWSERRAPDHLIVVVDGSVAMAQAGAEDARVAERVRATLSDALDRVGTIGPDRASLVIAGSPPRPVAAHWDWRPGVLDPALSDFVPADTAADWTATAALVARLTITGEDTRVLVIGPAAPDPALVAVAPDLAAIALVPDGPRAAISAAIVAGTEPGQWSVTADIRLPAGEQAAQLVLGYADGPGLPPLPWVETEVTADGTGHARFSRMVTLPGPGLLTLALDGQVMARFVTGQEATPSQVLYIGPGDQPLLQALQAEPGLALFQADGLPADLSPFRAVIIDRTVVDRQPDVPALWIGNAGVQGAPLPLPVAAPDPDDWAVSHPLTRWVEWSDLVLTQGWATVLPAEAEVLVSAAGAPLVAALDDVVRPQVWIGFDPADTNLPGTPDLAMLAAGAMTALGLSGSEQVTTACTAGLPCIVSGLAPGIVLDPIDGAERPLVVGTGPLIPVEAGLFGAEGAPLIAVNAAMPEEAAAPARDGAPPLARGWAPWLAAAVLILVLADVLLAARRRGRIGLPTATGVLAVALAAAALIRPPLPTAEAAGAVVVLGPAGADAHGSALGIATGPDLAILPEGRLPQPADGPLQQTPAALELAAAMVPVGGAGQVILTGDPATRPSAAMMDRLRTDLDARAATLRIDHLPPAAMAAGELVLHAPDLPPAALPDEPVAMTLRVVAGGPAETTLRLLRDGEEILARAVTLRAGPNRIETTLPGLPAGNALIEAVLDPVAGDDPDNNRAGRILSVIAPRPVAVVAAAADHGRAMADLLAGQGLNAEVIAPSAMPDYARGWLRYGGVVLLNTPAIAMTRRQQEILAQAVRDHGLGLLMLGGANAFGPGGYFETPLEDLSPLSAKVPRDAPEVAMLFVLDRSGSMQQAVGEGNRLDVAKQAALAAIDLLNPQSQVGIVVFDAEARTILPLSPLDRAAAEAALDSVDPGGGTAVFPGLVAALDLLKGAQSPARHVIVMTDGLSQPGDWPAIIAELRALGATVSAVAIGQGSDRTTVETIAALGGGAAHVTSDFAALPSILSQEAMMFAAPIEELPSQPVWRDTGWPFLAGLPNPMPPVSGFVLTTAKPEARVILITPDSEGEDAPLMAAWRVGNGQVLGFASDATGPWTADWHALEGYAGLWAGALRAFHPLTLPPGTHLTAESDGETLHVTLAALDRDGAPLTGLDPRLTVTAPDGALTELAMRPNGAQLYEAALPLGVPGRYDLTAATAAVDGTARAAHHHSYPVDRDLSRTSGAAAWLAVRTGGVQIDASGIATAAPGTAWRLRPAFAPWLLLALAAFMAELIRRYGEFPRLSPTAPSRGGDPT